MWKTFVSLFESKPFVVALLTAAAAAGAVLGFNVPVAAIVAFMTPLMIYVGAAGWTEVVAMKAKIETEAAKEIHAASSKQFAPALLSTAAPRDLQSGRVTLGVMALIVVMTGFMVATSGALVTSTTGCAEVQPVVTDVIDCVKAEAAVVSQGYEVSQIFSVIVGDIESIATLGLPAVYALIADAITTYGGDIVACGIDNYPDAPAAGSGSATPLLASTSQATTTAAFKSALLAKYFPGKHIKHSSKHKS